MKGLVAFIVAPFPAALFQAIVVAFQPKDGMGVFEHPASMFVLICLLFYAFGLVFGLPAIALLRKRKLVSWRSYAAVGFASVTIPIALALATTWTGDELSVSGLVYNLIFFAIGGLAAGTTYWLLTRPDRREVPLETIFE